MSDQYFVLRDDVGVTADGNLEPLRQIGITLAVPIMRDGELVDDPHRYIIRAADTLKDGALARFLPGTRTVHCVDPRVADAIRQSQLFEQTDPPAKSVQAEQRNEARAARQEAGTHKGDPDRTNPDNPIVEG